MRKLVFISHSSEDREVAVKICSMLEDRGVECWIAPRDVQPGGDYAEQIIRGIESTIATVLLLTEHSNASVFVKKEIERAVSKSKAIFPVRLREVAPSPGLELFISSEHWVDAWQAPIDAKIDQLSNAICALVSRSPLARVPSSPSPTIKPRRMVSRILAGLVVFLTCIGIGAIYWRLPPQELLTRPQSTSMEVLAEPRTNIEIQKSADGPTADRNAKRLPNQDRPSSKASINVSGEWQWKTNTGFSGTFALVQNGNGVTGEARGSKEVGQVHGTILNNVFSFKTVWPESGTVTLKGLVNGGTMEASMDNGAHLSAIRR